MLKNVLLHNLLVCGPKALQTAFELTHMSRMVFFADQKDPTKATGADAEKTGDEKEKEDKKTAETEAQDKKKKEAAAEEEKKKKPPEGEEKDIVIEAKTIGERAKEAANTAATYEKMAEKTPAEKESLHALQMHQIHTDFQILNEEDERTKKPVAKFLKELVARKKISQEQADKIARLNPSNPNFKAQWAGITQGIKGLPRDSQEHKKLFQLINDEKYKQEALEVKFQMLTKKMREKTREMNDSEAIVKKIKKEEELKSIELKTGLNIQAQQILKYQSEEKDEEGKPIMKFAKIKEVKWEQEYDDGVDEKGKPIKGKYLFPEPKIIIESQNAVSGEIPPEGFTRGEFMKWAEQQKVEENIETLQQLKTSLKLNEVPKKGDKIEYKKVIGVGKDHKPAYEDVPVQIQNINENSEPPEIELSAPVPTADGQKKTLSFAEFSKWYKQNEALPAIETLKQLRDKLYQNTQVLNEDQTRNSIQYPAIEILAGEVLYFNDGSKKRFVIKEVKEKEKKIIFSNGESKSFAGFFRWVKDKHVEKMTPEAEAAKASEHETDPAKKKAAHDEAKEDAKKDIAELKKAGEEPHKDYVLPSTEDDVGHSVSYMTQLWRQTHFMSISDYFEMGKTIVEFVTRKLHRWQHGKVGAVGESLFGMLHNVPILNGIAPEFTGMLKHAEDEEVQHHIKHMEHMGIDHIKKEAQHSPDSDTLKAAITVLCKKGQMRWDDEKFWHNLEHWTGVHIRKEHYREDIERAIDLKWGPDHFREFRTSQDSSYNSIKDGFKDHATRLDAEPGSLKTQLQKMLSDFLQGKYVNPAQFEEYIDFAIDAGKMGFEDKIFFIIMGMGATNPAGESLLAPDRAAALDGKYLVKVPILEYFTSPWHTMVDEKGDPIPDPKNPGEFKKGPPNLNAFKKIIREHILPDFGAGTTMADIGNLPPEKLTWATSGHFVDFVRDEMATDEWVRYRVEKASRDPSQWDHDDMDMFAQLLNESSIDQILRYSGGARLQVSFTGLNNSFAGLNDFIKRRIAGYKQAAEAGDTAAAEKHYAEMMRMMKAFMRFHATVDRRYEHENQQGKVRYTEDMYNSSPLCAHGTPVKTFIDELNVLIGNMAKDVGMEKEFQQVMEKIEIKPENKAKYTDQGNLVEKFGNMLQKEAKKKYIDSKNISGLVGIIDNKDVKLTGLTKKNVDKGDAARREMEEQKLLQGAQKAAADKPSEGGHGTGGFDH